MSYGKEKNKCKLRSYFVLFEGVLRFGTDLKECVPVVSSATIEAINTEGSRSKTDGSLHFVSAGHDIWLLPPLGEKDSWFSSISLTINKSPYCGNVKGPFRPLPSGLVKMDSNAKTSTKASPETNSKANSENITKHTPETSTKTISLLGKNRRSVSNSSESIIKRVSEPDTKSSLTMEKNRRSVSNSTEIVQKQLSGTDTKEAPVSEKKRRSFNDPNSKPQTKEDFEKKKHMVEGILLDGALTKKTSTKKK